MKKNIEKFLKYYNIAHRNRLKWYDVKWRTFVVILFAFVSYFIYSFLQRHYNLILIVGKLKTTVADELFFWFMIGFLLGIVAFAFLFEGEYILSIMKITRIEEEKALKHIKKLEKRRKK